MQLHYQRKFLCTAWKCYRTLNRTHAQKNGYLSQLLRTPLDSPNSVPRWFRGAVLTVRRKRRTHACPTNVVADFLEFTETALLEHSNGDQLQSRCRSCCSCAGSRNPKFVVKVRGRRRAGHTHARGQRKQPPIEISFVLAAPRARSTCTPLSRYARLSNHVLRLSNHNNIHHPLR